LHYYNIIIKRAYTKRTMRLLR